MESDVTDSVSDDKRNFLKQVALLGTVSSAVGIAMAPSTTLAQMLETGVRDDSVLAKCRKEGVLRVGYAQTGPWFYKDAKTGELNGIYKDVVDTLAKEIQVKVEWKEVTFANVTVALRRGDFDLFGSSLVYLVPRALVVEYIGPLYSKGTLLLCHKDNAERFKTAADLNRADVTFSVTSGASEEPRIPLLFPAKPKVITTTGQVSLGAEPVRAKRADVWISGDSDVIICHSLWGSGVEKLPRFLWQVPDHQRRSRATFQISYGKARRGVTHAAYLLHRSPLAGELLE
jgi:ABC-type amino acid transport substrate-binding protein